MINYFFLDVTENVMPYEIVVVGIVILVVGITTYFMAKHIFAQLKDSMAERRLVRKDKRLEQNETENLESNLIVEHRSVSKKSKDILGLINQVIYHSKEGQTISVMFYLNLDEFHFILEKYTEKQIAKIIQEMTKRLKKFSNKNTIAGYIKDDNFIVYHTGDINSELITTMASEILEAVRQPLKSVPEEITASMGIVLFPFDGISATQLIKNAEIALYVSKKEGKNRYSLYSQDLIEKEQFNISYYQEIKKAISNDEFLLYYQPIVDVKTGRMIGMESLLRWDHPTMGILPPGKFLNVMDLTGDITWFGKWGFEKIVQQYLNWKRLFKIRDLFISTNLSPKQLVQPGLAEDFFNIVRKYEFSAEYFCLEILDYYSIIRNPNALQNISEFRRFGFRVAMDDLGNQFEILEDMPKVKANIIKIAREDVLKVMSDYADYENVTQTILLAQQNQKIVIAEGIEDEDMIEKMSSFGIRFMQGYYFSQPQAADEIGKLFKNQTWNADELQKLTK